MKQNVTIASPSHIARTLTTLGACVAKVPEHKASSCESPIASPSISWENKFVTGAVSFDGFFNSNTDSKKSTLLSWMFWIESASVRLNIVSCENRSADCVEHKGLSAHLSVGTNVES